MAIVQLVKIGVKAHALYGERATSENWIEWCKNHMAAGSFLTQKF